MIAELLQDKTKKQKVKTENISQWLLDGSLPVITLVNFAKKARAADKATCIEAFEYATKMAPGIANEKVWQFVTNALTDKMPRVKWESARVIGNTAGLFPTRLAAAVKNLLANTTHKGTVVRWATAFALGEIVQLQTTMNKTLLPAIEAIYNSETDNGVRKKYWAAIKKVTR